MAFVCCQCYLLTQCGWTGVNTRGRFRVPLSHDAADVGQNSIYHLTYCFLSSVEDFSLSVRSLITEGCGPGLWLALISVYFYARIHAYIHICLNFSPGLLSFPTTYLHLDVNKHLKLIKENSWFLFPTRQACSFPHKASTIYLVSQNKNLWCYFLSHSHVHI